MKAIIRVEVTAKRAAELLLTAERIGQVYDDGPGRSVVARIRFDELAKVCPRASVEGVRVQVGTAGI